MSDPHSTQKSAGQAAPSKMSDLPARVASGVVMIAAALAALWWGGHAFVIFWLAAAAAIWWEWLRLTGMGDLATNRQHFWIFAIGAGALAVAAALAAQAQIMSALIALAAGAAIAAALARQLNPGKCALGMFYAGLFLIALIALRVSLQYGVQAVLWLFAVVWGADILAYFGGRSIGGPKLWPRVSPSKTWSGFLCGVLGGALAGAGVIWLSVPAGRTSLLTLFAIGVIVAAFSQMGDLYESALKRKAGVKDSSQLIPGHGGVMDRLDGFNFACVLAGLIALSKDALGQVSMLNAAAALLIW
ncbi:MAG: phosphatidate cytidylyltransferase [Alphaproteobacteria bacterium]|nr:phosphatidate cytidylyltransferase [Alphaproteobacteria bacterium]